MPESMSEMLEVMMQLQDKDLELRRLLETQRSIPVEVERRSRQLEEEKRRVAEKEEELSSLKKKRRSLEAGLEELEESIKKKESQLLSVANNKEYQAMLGEIESAKGRQSEFESELLVMMDKEEELAREVEGSRESLEPRVAEIERSKQRLVDELGQNEEMIPLLEKARAEIAARLTPDMRNRYERIARGKAGLAVVPIKKGACGGCFTAQPRQRINEVKRNDRLITCEGCGRVLVWNDGSSGEGGGP